MSSHSVRELKNNPSELLRELDSGQTAVLTRRGEPVGVAVPFETVLRAGAETAVAMHLLAEGTVTLGRAARMSGRSVEAFLEVLADAGLEDVLTDRARLAEDEVTLAGL